MSSIDLAFTPPLYAGTGVLTTITFYPAGSQTPTDPTTISLIVSSGTGVVTTYNYGIGSAITRVSAGIYTGAFSTSGMPGLWTIQWVGTGAVELTLPVSFSVDVAPL